MKNSVSFPGILRYLRWTAVGLAAILSFSGSSPWTTPYQLCPGVFFCEFSGGRAVIADPKRVEFIPSLKHGALREVVERRGAIAGINGGYFNHSDLAMASYLTYRGKVLADPHQNHLLVSNPKLRPLLPKIFNRTEFRVLGDRCSIVSHSVPTASSPTLSLQAGPRLLPTLGLTQEGFVSPGRDPLRCKGVLRRSALGIRFDGKVVIATLDATTLAGLANEMRRLGCQEAMALDGGSSTAMVVKSHCYGGSWVRCALLVRPKTASED